MRRRREGFLVWPESRARDKIEPTSTAPKSTKAWKMEQKSDMAMLAPLARLYPNKPLPLHNAANPLPPSYLHPALLIAHSFPPLSLNSFRAEYDKSRIRTSTISRPDFLRGCLWHRWRKQSPLPEKRQAGAERFYGPISTRS